MISVRDMQELERKACGLGMDSILMMENAGANAARIADRETGLRGKDILVFCGTGNNAGDGFVFGRHALVHGAMVSFYFVKGMENVKGEPARRNLQILNGLKSMGLPIKFYEKQPPEKKADILVDAMLGIGLKNNVDPVYSAAIRKFNSLGSFKIALDCPSGIDCDTGKAMGIAVVPDLTITFHDVKNGLDRRNSGKIIVADIGLPRLSH